MDFTARMQRRLLLAAIPLTLLSVLLNAGGLLLVQGMLVFFLGITQKNRLSLWYRGNAHQKYARSLLCALGAAGTTGIFYISSRAVLSCLLPAQAFFFLLPLPLSVLSGQLLSCYQAEKTGGYRPRIFLYAAFFLVTFLFCR